MINFNVVLPFSKIQASQLMEQVSYTSLALDSSLKHLTFFMFVRASMTTKTLYYPTNAQTYNSYIQLELL